jgi:hypothetical protein
MQEKRPYPRHELPHAVVASGQMGFGRTCDLRTYCAGRLASPRAFHDFQSLP